MWRPDTPRTTGCGVRQYTGPTCGGQAFSRGDARALAPTTPRTCVRRPRSACGGTRQPVRGRTQYAAWPQIMVPWKSDDVSGYVRFRGGRNGLPATAESGGEDSRVPDPRGKPGPSAAGLEISPDPARTERNLVTDARLRPLDRDSTRIPSHISFPTHRSALATRDSTRLPSHISIGFRWNPSVTRFYSVRRTADRKDRFANRTARPPNSPASQLGGRPSGNEHPPEQPPFEVGDEGPRIVRTAPRTAPRDRRTARQADSADDRQATSTPPNSRRSKSETKDRES